MFSVLNHNIEKGNDQSKFNFIFFNFNVNIRGSIVIGVREIFCQGGGGGGGEPFAQKILASCPNFYETVEKKRGSYDALT